MKQMAALQVYLLQAAIAANDSFPPVRGGRAKQSLHDERTTAFPGLPRVRCRTAVRRLAAQRISLVEILRLALPQLQTAALSRRAAACASAQNRHYVPAERPNEMAPLDPGQ